MVEGNFDFRRTGAGGMIFEKPLGLEFAAVFTNITPHPEQGIGGWSGDEIKKAITQGISRDGRALLPVMGFDFYRNISDEDLGALIVLPAVGTATGSRMGCAFTRGGPGLQKAGRRIRRSKPCINELKNIN